jgi:hypothetical protein
VTFSEEIRGVDVSDTVAKVFQVWLRNSDGTFELVPGFLDSIGMNGTVGFLTARTSNSLRFVMSNGRDLTSDHYLNIMVNPSDTMRVSMVQDVAPGNGNFPEENNQRVQVFVEPVKPDKMKSVPNPAGPASQRQSLTVKYDGEARQRVLSGQGGAVLTFPVIKVPGTPDDIVDGTLRIYDLAGNLVGYAEMGNMLATVPDAVKDGGLYNYDIYWDCRNQQGFPVAPGVYRAILKVRTRGYNGVDRQFVSIVGVRRGG